MNPSQIRPMSRYCLPSLPACPRPDRQHPALPRLHCRPRVGQPSPHGPAQPAPVSYRGRPKSLLQSRASERWMSGLSRTPGKRVWANPHRGFESRPLRHTPSKTGPYTGPVFVSGPAFGPGPALRSLAPHPPGRPSAHQGKSQAAPAPQALRRPLPGHAIRRCPTGTALFQ